MISTNHQARLNRENAKPANQYGWHVFLLLAVMTFIGPIAIMGAV